MKKLIPFLSLLFSNIIAAQQPFFYSQPTHSSEIFKVISLPNKQYAYLGKSNSVPNITWGREQFFVGILDSNLNQIKIFGQGILPSYEVLNPAVFGRVNRNDVNELYIGYNQRLCDLGDNKQQLIYLDYDTGATYDGLWDLKEGIETIMQTNSGYLMGQKTVANSFQQFDPEHNLDFIQLNLANDEKASLMFAGENHFYFYTNKNKFISTDVKGQNIQILGSFKPTGFYTPYGGIEIIPNKKILYRIVDTLFYTDFQNNIKRFRKLDNSFNTVCKFEANKKEIYLTDGNNSLVLDINFNELRNEKNTIKINGFLNLQDSVYFYGSEQHVPSSLSKVLDSRLSAFRPIKKEERNLNLNIEKIQFANNPPIITGKPNTFGQTVQFGTITVSLKNLSKDTIKCFYLNSVHRQNSFVCYGAYHQTWEFLNTIIPPNQTTEVSLPNVVINNTWKDEDDKFCLWVSLINSQPDKNLGYNEYCEPFKNIIATENVQLNSETISIYPNPTNSFVQIEVLNDDVIQSLEIIELNGKIILSQIIDNQNIAKINTEHLPHGIYLLKIKQSDGFKIFKLAINDL